MYIYIYIYTFKILVAEYVLTGAFACKRYETDFRNSTVVIDRLKASTCELEIFHRGWLIHRVYQGL